VKNRASSDNKWFSPAVYEKRVYFGFGKGDPNAALHFGPNIIDWPNIPALPEHLLVKVCSYITDPVTTTDELIPSGETSSYRSNPLRLAEFTLSRKDPGYVGRAKAVVADAVPSWVLAAIRTVPGTKEPGTVSATFSAIYAHKPGDGSAREQAASCQRVLGGAANFAREYATKRYRSNLLNWGIVPFLVSETDAAIFGLNDYIFVPNIRTAIADKVDAIDCYVVTEKGTKPFKAKLGALTDTERQILLDGCLINYYAKK
jgi:aconitate hydratase